MSETTSLSEGGCGSSEDLKIKKSLKSAVITDEDPLKIKLKICKTDIAAVEENKKESFDVKCPVKNQNSFSEIPDLKNSDEKNQKKAFTPSDKLTKINSDLKMNLRPKKETEEECDSKKHESEKGGEEKRSRKKPVVIDRDEERPAKKRMKMKVFGDENFGKREEGTRNSRKKRVESVVVDVGKPKEVIEEPVEVNKESFCWTCHKDGSVVRCDTCPRVFHLKCVSLTKDPSKDWICPECSLVLHAEKISTRSEAMKSLSLDQLCTLLNFAIGRMKNVPESQAFWKPVDPKEVPNYNKYITNPMDLNLLERNMKAKMYGSPQAFLADAKWLLHNSIIFNSTQSPLTSTARFLVKICRQEMAEIENCPDCYLNAHTKDNWFIEVCRKPHILIWARLKGFPFWPAKAMSTNLKTQQVDARFFGAHDKAWVPVKECYLYSKNSPQLLNKKRSDLDDAFLEAENYIKKIRQKFGSFSYAPDKTPFMPEMYDKQLQSMIPNFKEDKPAKKKRKSEQTSGENGIFEKPLQNGRGLTSHETFQQSKMKRTMDESSKVVANVCEVGDYVSEEKITNDDRISPEDEIARSLEMFDTHKKEEKETPDECSSDLDECGSIPIPEHGYSRSADNSDSVQCTSDENQNENQNENQIENENENENENQCVVQKSEEKTESIESSSPVEEDSQEPVENECTTKTLDEPNENEEENIEKVTSLETRSDQCEKSVDNTDVIESKNKEVSDSEASVAKNTSTVECQPNLSSSSEQTTKVLEPNLDSTKQDEEKSTKSFSNLTCDQQQKILTEAKLLANIDEMSAFGKQKVLNKLGLDASQVDIRQLAQENRQILETLNKKCQSEKTFEEVSIKNEDFEQYLLEENHEENFLEEELSQPSFKCGSINVKDFQNLTIKKSSSPGPVKTCTEPMLKITDVQSLRELKLTGKDSNSSRKKCLEDSTPSKKNDLEPVIKLMKLDSYAASVEKLNRKLRLSDEVSLLVVDGEKKVDVECIGGEQKKSKTEKKIPRARKSMPNRSRAPSCEVTKTSKNISVISVDTENSSAQKKLLKSLCLEEKNPEDSSKKTLLITTNEKGSKNVDVKNTGEGSAKKQMKEVTIEAVKETGKGNDVAKDGSFQKNLAIMTNSHLLVTNAGSAIVTGQNNQSNIALAQNNLGQLSLVHLSNLTSGIQTNFINLTNETIGFNNSIGTLYTSSGFNTEFPVSTATSSVILTPSVTTTNIPNAVGRGGSPTPKGGKGGNDSTKLSNNRTNTGKQPSGISVKSPASLGLVTSQPNKAPPMIAISGDSIPIVGGVGSVTAELNKHSIKMAEYMRAMIEDILKELSNQGSLEAKCKLLSIEMEKLQWRHQQEIMELKHHSERSLIELRNTLESEKQKSLSDLKAQLESQHQKILNETKRKQWCANCGKEALFYCCWNTSYCDYPCQQQHWPGHMSTCAQLGNNVTMGSSANSQLQSKTPGIKYQNSNYAPMISKGGSGSGGSGSHSGGVFAANRAIPTVQALSSQGRRSSDPSSPQYPINITIRPQHYFM